MSSYEGRHASSECDPFLSISEDPEAHRGPRDAEAEDGASSPNSPPPWMRPRAWRSPPTPTLVEGPELQRPLRRRRRTTGRGIPNIAEPGEVRQIDVRTLMVELLPVLRGLERSWRLACALEAQLAERLPPEDPLPDRQLLLTQSLKSLWSRLQDMLQAYDLALLNPLGEPFTPKTCHPITVRGGTGSPEGTVVEVLAFGYAHGARILVPAEVVVAAEA